MLDYEEQALFMTTGGALVGIDDEGEAFYAMRGEGGVIVPALALSQNEKISPANERTRRECCPKGL